MRGRSADSQKSGIHRTGGRPVKENGEMPPEYEELEIRDMLDRNEHIDQTIVVSKSPRLPVLCGACRFTVFPAYLAFREVATLRSPGRSHSDQCGIYPCGTF